MSLEALFNIENQTIVITGVTGYLGRAMMIAFDRLGAQVIALSRTERIHDVINQESLHKTTPYIVDFFDQESLKSTLTKIVQERPVIDTLINNAYAFSYNTGFNTPDSKLECIPDTMIFQGMESGIYWPFIASQILGKTMTTRKKGSIINIASMYGVVSPDRRLYKGKTIFNPITYSIAKSAVLGMTRYFASFWGEYGIRCNAVSPGAFPNTSGDSYNSNQDIEMLERLENKTLLGRIGKPNDLIGVLVLLASDASSYITGQNFCVDGGWTAI